MHFGTPSTHDSALAGEIGMLVLDLETTGKDPVFDRITEVAVIAVDPELRELFRVTTPIELDAYGKSRMEAEPIVLNMTRDSGLLADLTRPGVRWPTIETVDRTVAELASRAATGRAGKWVIAGSGVGAHDVAFIRRQMPELEALCVYYPHDIGILRREYRRAVGEDLVDANKNKTHRAMDDAECHLQEIRAFRAVLTDAFASERIEVGA